MISHWVVGISSTLPDCSQSTKQYRGQCELAGIFGLVAMTELGLVLAMAWSSYCDRNHVHHNTQGPLKPQQMFQQPRSLRIWKLSRVKMTIWEFSVLPAFVVLILAVYTSCWPHKHSKLDTHNELAIVTQISSILPYH